MTNNGIANKYMDSNILTASPSKLVVLLYEGSISNLKKADYYLKMKNKRMADEQLYKAYAIIGELMATLDMSYDISNYLMAIYKKIYNTIIQCIQRKDNDLSEPIEYMTTMLEAWKKVEKDDSFKGSASAAATTLNLIAK